MEIFKLFGSIFVNTDDAEKSMQKTEKGAESVASKFSKGIQTAGKWSAAVVGGSAVAGSALVGVASKSASTADNIDKMSQRLGLSRKSFQELDFVLSQSGVDINSFQTGMKSLLSNMDKCNEGNETAIANFNKLGVSVTDASGNLRSQEDVLKDTIIAFQAMEDSAEKSRLAQEIFGKQGQEILPLLNSEAGTFEELTKKANELGLVLSDETVDAGVKLTDTIDQMKRSLAAVGTNLGAAVMPIVQQFAQLIIDNLPTIQNLFFQLEPILTQLMQTLLPPLIQLVSDVLPVVMEILMALMPTVTQIVEMILPILLDLITTLLPPLLQIVQSLLPVVNALLSAALPILQVLIDTLKPILDLVIALLVPIIDIISQALQPLIEIIGILISTALKPLSWIIQVVSEAFGTYLKNMLQVVQDIIGKITGIFQGIVTFLKGVFTGNFEMIFKGLRDIVKNYFGGIVEAVKLPINAMISLLNGFISGLNKIQIPDWVPAVGGKGLNIPSIPLLEKGGILEKGQVGLLEGNGAEAVVPLENNKRWISSLANEMQVQGIAGEKDTESASLISVLIQTIEQKIEDKSEIIIEVLERILERIEELGIKEDGDIIIPVYLMNNLIDEVIIDAKKRVSVRSGGMVSV